jgi:hypothetical protein
MSAQYKVLIITQIIELYPNILNENQRIVSSEQAIIETETLMRAEETQLLIQGKVRDLNIVAKFLKLK